MQRQQWDLLVIRKKAVDIVMSLNIDIFVSTEMKYTDTRNRFW